MTLSCDVCRWMKEYHLFITLWTSVQPNLKGLNSSSCHSRWCLAPGARTGRAAILWLLDRHKKGSADRNSSKMQTEHLCLLWSGGSSVPGIAWRSWWTERSRTSLRTHLLQVRDRQHSLHFFQLPSHQDCPQLCQQDSSQRARVSSCRWTPDEDGPSSLFFPLSSLFFLFT